MNHTIQIPMHRGEDNLTATIRLPGYDLAGMSLELEVTPRYQGRLVTLSTVTGGLSLDLPDGVVVHYDAGLISQLPPGKMTAVDLFAVDGATRRKITAGSIIIGQAGQFLGIEIGAVYLPVPGAHGWSPLFAAEPYQNSIVLRVSDWAGGGGDKPAIGQYLGPDGLVDDIEDATLFASVEAANAAVSAALAAAEGAASARDEAQAAVASGRVSKDTKAQLDSVISDFPDGAVGEVTGDPVAALIGEYRLEAGAWVQKSSATVPALNARVTKIETAAGDEADYPYGLVIANESGQVVAAFERDGTLAASSVPAPLRPLLSEPPAILGEAQISGVAVVIANQADQVLSVYFEGGTTVDLSGPPTSVATVREPVNAFSTACRGGGHIPWVNHPGAVLVDGDRLIGGCVGAGSVEPHVNARLWLYERIESERITTYPLGRARQDPAVPASVSDDHVDPVILWDPRPDASYPLMVFQAEHGSHTIRHWRSATGETRDLEFVGEILPGVLNNNSYVLIQRNPLSPDEIVFLTRVGGSSAARWYIVRSLDNGSTWQAVLIIDKHPSSASTSYDMYPFACPSLDGTGVHLVCQNRANTASSQAIIYFRYDFATGAFVTVTPAGEVEMYRADVWGGSFASFDPWWDIENETVKPLVMYAPPGADSKRLFHAWEFSPGKVECVFQAGPLGDFKQWVTRHAALDLATGATTVSPAIDHCGYPWEEPSPFNYYMSGCALVASHELVHCGWRVPGRPAGYAIAFSSFDGGATWAEGRKIAASDAKLGRPKVPVTVNWDSVNGRVVYGIGRVVALMEGATGDPAVDYSTFRDWSCNIILKDIP